MALAMLVAVRSERPLMQLVRLMQNLLMILLPTPSMNPAKPLYPRRMLALHHTRMRVPRMIRRFLHPRPPFRVRLHPALRASVVIMPLIVRMMKPPPVVLCHRYAPAVGVYV
jgi:hypothetical protein